MSQIDEREEFRYFQIYNENTDQVEKSKEEINPTTRWWYRFQFFVIISMVVGSQVGYYYSKIWAG